MGVGVGCGVLGVGIRKTTEKIKRQCSQRRRRFILKFPVPTSGTPRFAVKLIKDT
jgi:hypothetical protein